MDTKDKIIKEFEKGNVIVSGFGGLQIMPLAEFIKQETDGILYDLNRSEAVVLTFINDPKWVNDYAVCKVIRALKARINTLEQQLAEEKKQGTKEECQWCGKDISSSRDQIILCNDCANGI